MTELPACCNFCYRPAVRTFVQSRRGLAQVALRRPPRRACVCSGSGCAAAARDYLRTGASLGAR